MECLPRLLQRPQVGDSAGLLPCGATDWCLDKVTVQLQELQGCDAYYSPREEYTVAGRDANVCMLAVYILSFSFHFSFHFVFIFHFHFNFHAIWPMESGCHRHVCDCVKCHSYVHSDRMGCHVHIEIGGATFVHGMLLLQGSVVNC